MIPPDFKEIPDDNYDLFYKIMPTGDVLLTGDKQRCVLSCLLEDGSKLQGGITESGYAFGTRVDKDGASFQVGWQDVYQSAVSPEERASVVRPLEVEPPPEEQASEDGSEYAKFVAEDSVGSVQLTVETLEEFSSTIASTLREVQRVQAENLRLSEENYALLEELATLRAKVSV